MTPSARPSALAGTGGFGLSLGGAIAAGAGAGFASGFAGSLLNGGSIGDAFKAGVIGGIVGGITGGLAHGIGTAFEGVGGFDGWAGRALAHGVVQGGAAELQGGQFRHGFYAGFATAGASPFVGDGLIGAMESAVIGGTASVIGGGKFVNGARSSTMQYLLNHAQHPPSRKPTSKDDIEIAGVGIVIVPNGDPADTNVRVELIAALADVIELANFTSTAKDLASTALEKGVRGVLRDQIEDKLSGIGDALVTMDAKAQNIGNAYLSAQAAWGGVNIYTRINYYQAESGWFGRLRWSGPRTNYSSSPVANPGLGNLWPSTSLTRLPSGSVPAIEKHFLNHVNTFFGGK